MAFIACDTWIYIDSQQKSFVLTSSLWWFLAGLRVSSLLWATISTRTTIFGPRLRWAGWDAENNQSGGSVSLVETVGSVGQPRDGEARASFLTIDDDFVRFHRIDYHLATTVDKIHSIPDIDKMHGDRLLHGR